MVTGSRVTGSATGLSFRVRAAKHSQGVVWHRTCHAPKTLHARGLFAKTSDLVQRMQVARRELAIEAALNKLDHFDVLILDDLAGVTKDQAETSALFELISARYERRSMIITANQPFGQWGKVFQNPAMTLAAVDRLVHHSTIFEMNLASYRRRTAIVARPDSVPTARSATGIGARRSC